MPTGIRRIGPAVSHVTRSLRKIQAKKRPSKRKNESRDHYMGRVGIWLEGQKKQTPKKIAGKKLTERERRIKARKDAEALLGVKRGIKKKKKK